MALRLWPGDGFARANQASLMIVPGATAQDLARAKELAQEALRSEPTSAKAIRVIGMLSEAERDRAAARRQFQLSRELSRRDLLTTLWFLEEAVARNDTAAALNQYEIGLRTSRAAQGILFPVLDGALATKELVKPISGLLLRGEQWLPSFVEYVIKSGKQRSGLARALIASPSSLQAVPSSLNAALITTLVDLGEVGVAERLYVQLSGGGSQGSLIRNGDFSLQGPWAPFDWALVSTANYGGDILPESGVLLVYSREGGSGTVARQILSLRPGSYELISTTRNRSGTGSALWSLACAGQVEESLATMRVTDMNKRPQRQTFVVPGSACPHQWINLETSRGGETSRMEVEIDRIEIRRR